MAEQAVAGQAAQPTQGRVLNDFLNAPAALTFPVCTFLATALWGILQTFGSWATAPWVGVVAAFIIGLGLYLIDVLYTQQQQPRTRNDYILRGILAFFNAILLATSVTQVAEPVAEQVVNQVSGAG